MKNQMKAARLNEIGRKFRIHQVQVPPLGSNDVLVNVKASGICHSDINYRDGVSPVGKMPIILGHEIAGEIAEVGERVERIDVGDRVCVHYIVSCGQCIFCRMGRENFCEKYKMIGKDIDGGFAEYISIPASNAFRLPKTVPMEQGAILGCAVSTAYRALKRGRIDLGDTVLVHGLGGLGVHAVQMAARVFGAGKVIATSRSDEKLKLAMRLGADEVVNTSEENLVEKIIEITGGKLADVVVEFIGLRKTSEEAIECVGKGGRMVMVGIGKEDIRVSPYKAIIGKEMELVGVNDHLKSELDQLMRLVSSGRLDLSASVTHKMPLEEVNRGMEILEKKIGNPIRVVLIQHS